MTTFEPGDVVLVRFPFTDLTKAKWRPALVLCPAAYSTRHGDVVVMALTTKPQQDDDCRLERWQRAGLPRPSWIKPLIFTLDGRLVSRRIGRIDATDAPRVTASLRTLVDKRFLAKAR